MKITKDISWKLLIADIETLQGCLDFGFYNPDKDEWYEFEISQYKNQLFEFVNFYNPNDWNYIVYFNGISFDAQVIQYIIDNCHKWDVLSGLEICEKVYSFVQRLITEQSFANHPPFRESAFAIPVIDVFTLLGWNNMGKYTSLKKAEFSMDYHQVEEMPIHHLAKDLSQEEIQQIKDYRKNDVLATYEIFKICLGQSQHPSHKENNQIESRINIQEEFKIPCMSYSDIKIGDEILKKGCAEEMGIEITELPKKGTFRNHLALKDCIPKYIKFETPEFQKILTEIKRIDINPLGSKQFEKEFIFDNTKYTLGLGGGHSKQENEKWETNELYYLSDLDTSSQYPATACQFEYFPQHIKKGFRKTYEPLYHRRLELKPLAKSDDRIKGIVDGLKMVLNVPTGKFREITSWMYDAKAAISICLTSQMVILKLIEMCYLQGIHCFSFNTDGATFTVPYSKKEKYQRIIIDWELLTNFKLEEQKFDFLYYQGVNSYIGLKEGGLKAVNKEKFIKEKDEFVRNKELWQNKSHRIIPLALHEYFINNGNPIEFIKNHKNIYDFCIMARAKGQLHLEEQWEENNEIKTDVHKKLVRYYLSDTGRTLYKRGIGTTGKQMNNHINAPNELGEQCIQYFNSFTKKTMKNYRIDYNQYILKVLKIIDGLDKTKKTDSFINSLKPQVQIDMFA